jgi:hypothetical protein
MPAGTKFKIAVNNSVFRAMFSVSILIPLRQCNKEQGNCSFDTLVRSTSFLLNPADL